MTIWHCLKNGLKAGACGKNWGSFTLFTDKVTCKACQRTKFFKARKKIFDEALAESEHS